MAEEQEDIDLDFNDIAGAVPIKEKQKVQQEKKPQRKIEADYFLTYPTKKDEEDKTFKCVTLNECTNEDFLAWVECVYPNSERKSSDFNSKDIRLRALKTILRAHSFSLKWLRSNQKVDPKEKDN